MFKKNISQQEMLIAVVIYLISVPFVFQLLEKQYISFGLIKGDVEGFAGSNWKKTMCRFKCNAKHAKDKAQRQECKNDC